MGLLATAAQIHQRAVASDSMCSNILALRASSELLRHAPPRS